MFVDAYRINLNTDKTTPALWIHRMGFTRWLLHWGFSEILGNNVMEFKGKKVYQGMHIQW